MTCRYLTLEDRRSLEQLYSQGAGLSDIASSLKVHIATVYRELARGDTGELNEHGREGYSAEVAQKAFQDSLKRRGRKQTVTT